jgi:hypothetical protein
MISSRNTAALPEPARLNRLTKALAMLDAVIQPDWEYRYYSYNSKWADGEEMASMRNGQGDEWFCVFCPAGVFIKGFDHESKMSPWNQETPSVWPGVLDGVPSMFESQLKEPAFSMNDTTFCIWSTAERKQWQTGNIAFPDGPDPDGSGWMLEILDDNPLTYKKWAEEYYEREIDLPSVERIYQTIPLTTEVVRQLNPGIQLSSVLAGAAEIGFPVE